MARGEGEGGEAGETLGEFFLEDMTSILRLEGWLGEMGKEKERRGSCARMQGRRGQVDGRYERMGG